MGAIALVLGDPLWLGNPALEGLDRALRRRARQMLDNIATL